MSVVKQALLRGWYIIGAILVYFLLANGISSVLLPEQSSNFYTAMIVICCMINYGILITLISIGKWVWKYT